MAIRVRPTLQPPRLATQSCTGDESRRYLSRQSFNDSGFALRSLALAVLFMFPLLEYRETSLHAIGR